MHDYLIVGAGPYGCTIAERIANDLGKKVLVIDKRDHIGGNCFSETDPDTGIECHRYGTHIFHTSSHPVWDYLSRFMELNGYYHQVLTVSKGRVYQMPINLETINTYYKRTMTPSQAREWMKKEIAQEGITNPRNLEEKAISQIGRPLYEALIRGYTLKQWQRDPREIPPDIINRLPVRYNYNEDYFTEARWQGIPVDGYTPIFEKMLFSPNIEVRLNCDYFTCGKDLRPARVTIFTGPVDRYFDFCFGKLEWRSVTFRRSVEAIDDFQGTAVMNYADVDVPHTRIHEPRHLHPERTYTKEKTVVFYESSRAGTDDPYYPVNTPENTARVQQYRQKAKTVRDVIIGGRLGDYCYYDMDKTVLAALECYQSRIRPCQ